MARRRTVIFPVQGNRLRVSDVKNVIRDFYENEIRVGRFFSFRELGELIRIRKCPSYFCKSFIHSELLSYALPFLEEESLKTNEDCR